MGRADWIRHGAVFVAAIFAIWLSGVVPVLILKPGPYAGMEPTQILARMGGVDLPGLLRAWPIFIAIAICQALTFHYVKKWTTPIFLASVFALGFLMAWRYWTTYA
ncbi:MAG: hypothetical protein RIR33_584 [Pseudomonadota bacterium]|jgi:hypothetical protein